MSSPASIKSDVKQVLDEMFHPTCGPLDHLHGFSLKLGCAASENAGSHLDGPKRIAEVMGDDAQDIVPGLNCVLGRSPRS